MFTILFSILGGVLAAWILSLFGADVIIINVFQSLLPQVELTGQHYYVAFGLLGLILGIIAFIKRR